MIASFRHYERQVGTVAETLARLNTIEDVMGRLCIGRTTAFELIGTRRLRSVKVGRRRLVSESALVEFIEELDRSAQLPTDYS